MRETLSDRFVRAAVEFIDRPRTICASALPQIGQLVRVVFANGSEDTDPFENASALLNRRFLLCVGRQHEFYLARRLESMEALDRRKLGSHVAVKCVASNANASGREIGSPLHCSISEFLQNRIVMR